MSTHEISWTSFHNIINGQLRGSDKTHNGINPATGGKNWDIPVASQKDLDDAVISAQKAFESWSKTSLDDRKALVRKYKETWLSHADELIEVLVKETGKPRAQAGIEVQAIRYWFDHHDTCEIPEERVEDPLKVITTRYVPLGVVGAICPWNYPYILSMGKIIPAVLSGCTIIVKPSPFTPYSALKAVELAQRIFPPGVIQAVGGDDSLGPWMTTHPGIAKIAFTGSIATGKKIMAACAGTLKRVTLELGGNDPAIVLPDVDIQKVAPELVMGAFQNSGQVCVATKRFYIHQSIYDEMLKAMSQVASSMKIGDPEDSSTELGPIQNSMQYERVKGFYTDVKQNGYKIAVGSTEISNEHGGYFLQATIVDNPPNDSRIIQEEPFGPIVPAQPWTDEDDVIKRANDSTSGLGACVWSKDIEHAQKIAKRLEAGSVWINSWAKPTPQAMFSGHKESGIGGEWGKHSLLSYCNAQAIHVYK